MGILSPLFWKVRNSENLAQLVRNYNDLCGRIRQAFGNIWGRGILHFVWVDQSYSKIIKIPYSLLVGEHAKNPKVIHVNGLKRLHEHLTTAIGDEKLHAGVISKRELCSYTLIK